ncbi:DUF423 domain-containing protein [Aerolutibacter ruishenii]|uniref:Uncharacterized membrane protein YgdD (TMEM256/DUF423 family) n=1 Tax=Aerolutibacter ruishenii TaxID=686800 RepID=A0A562LI78_9GAMM|nr:DUF423 domain-containing protein [Lysobacter ruishenii]TWI07329.1 uncharacterized membrane protein YgdD (TMEM256/DUF423 family) [Lysobacter ruishenii]
MQTGSGAVRAPVRVVAGRWFAAVGAVLAALAVGLAAYASHGADGEAQSRLQSAALFLFGHGVALAALGPLSAGRVWRIVALAGLLFGTLLFSGSLVMGALAGWPTALAPMGGTLMMAGWLVWAMTAVRQ